MFVNKLIYWHYLQNKVLDHDFPSCLCQYIVLFSYNETERESKYTRNPRFIRLQTGSHIVFLAAPAPRRPCKQACERAGVSVTVRLQCPRAPEQVRSCPTLPRPRRYSVCAAHFRFPLSSWRSLEVKKPLPPLSGLHRPLKIPHSTVAHTAVLGRTGKSVRSQQPPSGFGTTNGIDNKSLPSSAQESTNAP